ncbi:bifunctional NUDIX hydrolase/histidine phosphatase family protein [Corynebacterium breve]|uniref:Bifunctional NUDIX hydrolase/histidine phosphatase family protein n=1 Tax=Corynebacterium breve TaxID=3049799 RepID=A0ABY8VKJ8_9CORY|nr:bifunctional NUDIX hydrolase/histidine phosphatase family protein [Corynebacterium breve]WIM68719.1 bifunctional NUDIX hydrolase/histidine phosphatase family protein [Corynebacterium breve]
MGKNNALHEQDKDAQGEKLVTGRLQMIPKDPAKEFKRTTLAAGAVLWRGDLSDIDSIEVACIHRPGYDDWSLAKGKVDPAESLPVTAVREILEETGYEVRLGKLLGRTIYPVLDRTKVVYYWTGEVIGGEFAPNEEVDEIRWLPIAEAQDIMTYDLDREVLVKAEKRFRLPATSRILYVRHAKAHEREKWAGDDNLRPLEKKGRRQAEMLVPMLAPFGPDRIYSAVPDRCQQTVAPLADELGLDVIVDKRLGDDGLIDDLVGAQQAFMDVVNEGGVSVIVSQGLSIPDVIAWLSANGRLPIDIEIKAKKASVWVLSFNNGELTGADYLPSPLPVR